MVAAPRRQASYDASLPLRVQAIQPRTAKLYRLSFRRFSSYVWNHSRLLVSSIPVAHLDSHFEAFVDWEAQRHGGRQRQRCVNALQGVFLVMGEHLRSMFPSSHRALAAWRRRVPSVSAPPLPEYWCDVLTSLLLLKGKVDSGLALFLSFHGLLRASEVLSLRGNDVLVRSSHPEHGGIRVRHAKTGRLQFARIQEPMVLRVLHYLALTTPASELLFPSVDYRGYVADLRWACRALRLPVIFTPHSARHGGATARFLRGDSPSVIRIAGRWSQYHSMEVYLQACACLLLNFNPPPEFSLLLSTGFVLRPLLLTFL